MIQNAKQLPAVYYGLHFSHGVAEYQEPGKDAYRIFINENTAKKMDPSFAGKPVYVDHVDEVNLANLEREIDGVVFDSFYNKADGKHWVRFEVHTDKGHAAIKRGWQLSNAYVPKSMGEAGLWHGVEYSHEIMDADYDHLAIVELPRYAESQILTPEQFKKYNEQKEAELKKFTNSKEKPKMAGFNFFKRSKVENTLDIENVEVTLPLSKKTMVVSEILNAFDKVLNMHGYASDDHMVKLNDSEEMSVKDMRERCNAMAEEMKAMKEKNDAVGEVTEGKDLGQVSEEKMYPNEEDAESDDEMKKKKKNALIEAKKTNFNKLDKAPERAAKLENEMEIVPIYDGIKRGKDLFGSN